MTRRKGINSRNKGSEYERKIARDLGAWWGEKFNRTPLSGGLQWKADNRVAGDIVTPPDSVFPWTVECKKQESWTLEQVLKGTGDVEKWWKQATRDSERVDLEPLLIFSRNFAPDYLMMHIEVFNKIVAEKSFSCNYFIVCVPGKGSRVICDLKDFTKAVSKESVIKALNLK